MKQSDISRDYYMLKGPLSKLGYDWWWHNFTAYNHDTDEEKAFFVEYYVCNPALGENKPVLGQLKSNQDNHVLPSYALVKAGTWGRNAKQIHNFYPIAEFSCPADSLQVRIADCTLTETHMKGKCTVSEQEVLEHPEYMCDAGEMSWDLKIRKQIPYHVGYGASKLFRSLNAFEMFWHAEGMKTSYEGTVTLDGIIYDVIPEKSYGYADKNWGKDFTSPWLWISSCNMRSLITGKKLDNSVIDAGGGRPKVLGIPLDRKLLIGMYYEGTMYEYNFSKPFLGSKVKFQFHEGEKRNTWKIIASNRSSVMKLKLYCTKDEMLFVNYEAPNGKKLHNRLWNGGTGYGEIKLYQKHGNMCKLIDHIEIKNAGCEYGEYE